MAQAEQPIRIGVSACLLGQQVRFDGGHKESRLLTHTLSKFVEFVPVCPEMELGLGAPRESLRLVRDGRGVRLVAPRSGTDHTDGMRTWAKRRLAQLAEHDLCGYVLKKDSPSCGMERVRVYDSNGMPQKDGSGLFAAALREAFPHLPVEEEGRLEDAKLRENFFERVFAYARLKAHFSGRWTLGDLVRFHTSEKLLLMAHHEPSYRELGRLVAAAKKTERAALAARYQELFMGALEHVATTKKHVNALQHIVGHFREELAEEARAALRQAIEDYRLELVPLVVPITLLAHHARLLNLEYLVGQTYLEPSPRELRVRNHV